MRNPFPPILIFLHDRRPLLAKLLHTLSLEADEILANLAILPGQLTGYRRAKLRLIEDFDTEDMVRLVLEVTPGCDLSPILEELKELAGLKAAMLARRDQLLNARVSEGVQKHSAYLEELKATAAKRNQGTAERAAARKKAREDEKKRIELARQRWEGDVDTLAVEVWPTLPGFPAHQHGGGRTKPWWALFHLLEALEPQGYTLERLPRDVLKDLICERITQEEALARMKAGRATR